MYKRQQEYECIVPNVYRSAVSSPEMRKAILYAIDRGEIISSIYLSNAVLVDVPVTPDSYLYSSSTFTYEYSTARAQELLSGLGFADDDGDGYLEKSGASFKLNIIVNENPCLLYTSTYLDGLTAVADPKDHRIHTRFTQNVTATGRLSSIEPNLQNIPTRTDLGSEIRKMFIPADGCVLVDADYSQIELRLLAHISGDEAMRAAFLSGGDFHAETAAKVFHVAPELSLIHILLENNLPAEGFVFDTALAAYLLDATAGSYDLQDVYKRQPAAP